MISKLKAKIRNIESKPNAVILPRDSRLFAISAFGFEI
jgi:hypothetical protein